MHRPNGKQFSMKCYFDNEYKLEIIRSILYEILINYNCHLPTKSRVSYLPIFYIIIITYHAYYYISHLFIRLIRGFPSKHCKIKLYRYLSP